jgi:hypothetical protein
VDHRKGRLQGPIADLGAEVPWPPHGQRGGPRNLSLFPQAGELNTRSGARACASEDLRLRLRILSDPKLSLGGLFMQAVQLFSV